MSLTREQLAEIVADIIVQTDDPSPEDQAVGALARDLLTDPEITEDLAANILAEMARDIRRIIPLVDAARRGALS